MVSRAKLSRMVWEQTIQATCPDGFFAHWIVDLMKRGTKIVTIDPSFSWFAARSKYWLQIRPGTDSALALGFLNVIVNEDLYDREFVEKWTNCHFLIREDTNDFLKESDVYPEDKNTRYEIRDNSSDSLVFWDADEVKYTSDSFSPSMEASIKVRLKNGDGVICTTVWNLYKKRLQEYSPEKVFEITWIPEDLIVKVARFYAKSKPAGIHWGLPIDTVPNTTYTAQAIAHLWCLTGNLDVPGGNVIARYAFDVITYPYYSKVKGLISLDREAHKKRIGTWKYKAIRDFRDWGHPDMATDQIITEDPYPIKGACRYWAKKISLLSQ